MLRLAKSMTIVYIVAHLSGNSSRYLFNGVFGFKYAEDGRENTYSLLRLADIPIVRYIKVKAEANPFDPAWDKYFAKRAERSNRQREAKGARDAQAA